MNAPAKVKVPVGLELLRQPFPEHQISKLPKPTKAQTEAVRADFKKGIRCKICGTWHHPDVVHLDYVGHAALTDRLLDCDPNWTWEPCVEPGLPNPGNGMWIKLTVCGVTRIGYGHADGKTGGDAIKETIGDALRNAAMRFGAALDLWHKGDLHLPEATPEGGETDTPIVTQQAADFAKLAMLIKATGADVGAICKAAKVSNTDELTPNQMAKVIDKLETKLADMAKAQSDNKQPTLAEELGDEIPY